MTRSFAAKVLLLCGAVLLAASPCLGCTPETRADCVAWQSQGACDAPGVKTLCPCLCGDGGGGGSAPPPGSPSSDHPPTPDSPQSEDPSPPPSDGNPSPPPSDNKSLFVAYFQSWSDKWAAAAATNTLATLPPYVNVVTLAFMKPDASYTAGSMSFSGTGLDFTSDASVVKGAIALLRQKGTKVLVSVGGATYTGWNNLNTKAITDFVKDFGLDGVDIDFEATPSCTPSGGSISCSTDAGIISAINGFRAALPSPYWVTAAAFSVGAYGVGSWANAQPVSPYTGQWVNPLKQAGSKLDALFVMSYDAGPTYSVTTAYAAYRSLYTGRIAMGVETPAEAWGGHELTASELSTLNTQLKQAGANGMMLWSLQKASTGITSQQVAQAVCSAWGLPSCTSPLFP